MDKRIDHKTIDSKWQQHWNDNKCFASLPDSSKPKFSTIIPPPNITGKAHIGHALNNTFQDVLCRYKRMKGFNVLAIPGTDHAGIATQTKVLEHLQKKGIDKNKLTREEFINEGMLWKNEYGGIIIDQLKKLGCSYDWSRLQFTLDPSYNKHVYEMFAKLYNDGLIYRGLYMINWCPILETAISDEEVIKKDVTGKLYYIKYKLANSDEYISVATSRPETLFGDVAIAYNLTDERYKKYHDKNITVLIPIINKEIPLIADNYVKPEFGSGLVKITPAHDKDDYRVGQKHNLPIVQILDNKANICNTGTKYDGISRDIARKIIIKELTASNLIDKIEEYQTVQKTCSRTNAVIEPMLSLQWFIKMEPLADICRKMVDNKEVEIFPQKFIKTFDNWLNNIHDWCISRQISWGHRIPIYYCNDCNKETCSIDNIVNCKLCNSTNISQDTDVLDTWASSWLFSYAVFDSDKECDYYFPNDLVITGEDILFFWIIKMMMAAGYMKGKAPFKKVFLHGLVRDEHNVKMTKSLGNVINPLDIIDKFGTDPMRFTLIMITPKENDLVLSVKSFDIGKMFCTKILDQLNNVIKLIDQYIEVFDFYHCGHILYSFVWDDFANTYLESTKKTLNENKQKILFKVLETVTRLLHPFCPHITEEIWEILRNKFNHSTKIVSLCDYP
jgi:valyl-tRNA synthetase